MGRVQNKIAIVTGAASGIGRGCARRLVAEGATVVCTDRDERGAQVAAELGAMFALLDVTDEAGWQRVVDDTVRAHGALHILVNAAGVAVWGDIEKTTLAEWRFVNQVNAEGTFLGCRAALAAMKATGGSIVNISSVAGLVADADAPAYCASKGAVRLLTKSVALHAARRGYNVALQQRASVVHRHADGRRGRRGLEGQHEDAHARREGGAARTPRRGRRRRARGRVPRERRVEVRHRLGAGRRWRTDRAIGGMPARCKRAPKLRATERPRSTPTSWPSWPD